MKVEIIKILKECATIEVATLEEAQNLVGRWNDNKEPALSEINAITWDILEHEIHIG